MSKKGKPARSERGVIDVTRSGKGFLVMPEGAEDILIPREHLKSALSGDIVEVEVTSFRGRPQGRVKSVLERKRNSFVGVLERDGTTLYMKPDDKRIYFDFVIVGGVGSPPGQKVIVDVTRWETDPPQATIRRSLGLAGSHDTEMRAILAGRGFESDFNADVIREADQLYERMWSEEEIATRRDFRGTLTMTIDPEDAKDHDDAISYKELEDGSVEIGVHIADVSHFVRPGSALDREAFKRGTSVYLVDRTVPMLPPQLSEDLCSLKPGVDRLSYSAVFTVKGTTVTERWFGRSIINSQYKLSYEAADIGLTDENAPLHKELRALNAFAEHLRKKRIEMGALIFDRDELKPVLNEKKEVSGFVRKTATPSRKLIEELMLLANREVASLVRKVIGKNKIFLYRIHDVPNGEKLDELSVFLRAIGYQLSVQKVDASQKEINRMLESIKGKPEEQMIKVATIRTMAKAIYSTKNIGHFGLSFKDYAHFTSPIRRYPDLMVHRTLTKVLGNERITDNPIEMEEKAVYASAREADAADAERASVRLKQVEYMESKIGQVRPGMISGVTEWGVYVEDKESGAEGMVRLENIPDDSYDYHPKKFAVIGARTKKVIRLGDEVMFTPTRVDLEERTIDVTIVLDPLAGAASAVSGV